MDILPAIDLRDGKVVRLERGDYDLQTTYSDDPATVALAFASAGAGWIHVVDLDGARTGRVTNLSAVRAIRAAVGAKLEFGGGMRDEAAIDAMLSEGVDRVVVGSAALKNWTWFEDLLSRRPDLAPRIALGLDARDGRVAAEGWTERLADRAVDIAARVRGSGLSAIVYTDIARDGMLAGVNVEATAEVIAATDVDVIASGGADSLEDVRRCRQIGCAGLIIGKAYYEGKIDLSRACALAREQESL